MSKQFEVKKETLSLINKAFSERSDNLSLEERYKDLEQKYKSLADLTKTLEKVYSEGKIHPLDLKNSVTESLTKILKPVREHFNKKPETLEKMFKIEKPLFLFYTYITVSY